MSDGDEQGRGGRRIPIVALIVVAVGVVLLLNTTGVAGWGIWVYLLAFWPVALIAVGLGLIFGRRAPTAYALMVAVLLAATVGGAYLLNMSASPSGLDMQVSRSSIASMEDIDALELDIDFAAGDLAVYSLGAGSADMLSADFYNVFGAITHLPGDGGAQGNNASNSGSGWYGYAPLGRDGVIRLDISPDSPRARFGSDGGGWNVDIDLFSVLRLGGPADWRIGLGRGPAIRLDVQGGAADIELRLGDLNVESLTLDVGAADIDIELPASAGQTEVYIDAGAANIDIKIPDGVAAFIYADSGFSSIDVDAGRFPPAGGGWRSADYDTAPNRVGIGIDAGASSISVR